MSHGSWEIRGAPRQCPSNLSGHASASRGGHNVHFRDRGTAADACATRPPDERASYLAVLREKVLQWPWSAVINQDSHLSCETRLNRASSIVATASSPFTLGYCSRNLSNVLPPSK